MSDLLLICWSHSRFESMQLKFGTEEGVKYKGIMPIKLESTVGKMVIKEVSSILKYLFKVAFSYDSQNKKYNSFIHTHHFKSQKVISFTKT